MLAGAAQGGYGVGVLAADEQHTLGREALQVDDTAFVLLDDFKTVATAGTAAEFGRGSEGGVREDENSSRGMFHFTCTFEQAARIIGDDDLLNAGKQCERFEFNVHSEFTRRERA